MAERSAPASSDERSAGLLARTRRLFLVIALLSALPALVMLLVGGQGGWIRQPAAFAALIGLGLWWSRRSALERAWPIADAAEGAAFVVLMAGLSEITPGLAFLFIALLFRSLYGSAVRVAGRAALYGIALGCSYAVAGQLAEEPVAVVSLVAIVPIVAALAHFLAGIIRRQERAAARERALVEASGALVAVETTAEACEAIARGALAVGSAQDGCPRPGTQLSSAQVWLRDGEQLAHAASSGPARADAAETLSLSELPAPLRERLRSSGKLSAKELEALRAAVGRGFALAEGAADSVLLAPMVVRERWLGVIAVAAPRLALEESARALETLAAEAGLVLDQLRLTDNLRRSEQRFRSLVLHTSDMITALDAGFAITYQSPSVDGLLGRDPDSVVDQQLEALLHPDDVSTVLMALAGAVPPSVARVEARMRRADGSYADVEIVANNLLSEPEVGMIVLSIRDVGERKALEEQLAHQAFHDPLTQLPNRALFVKHAEQALARARRGGAPVAVLMMDLDDFKRINDTLGHAAGDRLLTVLAERLRSCVRAADTVARIGGDEFALVLEQDADAPPPATIARRLLDELRSPVDLGDARVAIAASIGIAVSEAGEEQLGDLMRMADFAMYSAKSEGKGRAAAYEPAMLETVDLH